MQAPRRSAHVTAPARGPSPGPGSCRHLGAPLGEPPGSPETPSTGTRSARTDRSGAGSRRHLHGRFVRVLVAGRENAFDRRLAVEGAAAPVEVRLELLAKVPGVARDGIDREIPERAERLAEKPVADGQEQVEVGALRPSILD